MRLGCKSAQRVTAQNGPESNQAQEETMQSRDAVITMCMKLLLAQQANCYTANIFNCKEKDCALK